MATGAETASLKRRDRISRRNAHDMILTLAKMSNHQWHGRFQTDADVKRFFAANGYAFAQVVEASRNPWQFVPLVENIIGSTFVLSAPGGGSASFVNMETGEEVSPVSEHGIMVMSNYQHSYEQAAASLERAITDCSWGDFLSTLTHGIAAIEAFLNEQAGRWNETHPTQQLLDSKAEKVSFDDKIDKWIPILTGGRRLDKGDARWADFKQLRGIRDEAAVHIKSPVRGVSFVEMARLMNMTRTGIAGLLMHLHELFKEPVPSKIVRGVFAADVERILSRSTG